VKAEVFRSINHHKQPKKGAEIAPFFVPSHEASFSMDEVLYYRMDNFESLVRRYIFAEENY
jgi:hypothetical protein